MEGKAFYLLNLTEDLINIYTKLLLLSTNSKEFCSRKSCKLQMHAHGRSLRFSSTNPKEFGTARRAVPIATHDYIE